MQRRDFFRNILKLPQNGNDTPLKIRPPYFQNEDLFLRICATCEGVCKDVCEEGIITIAEDKTPTLDFSSGGCTFCDECAKACPKEVLDIAFKSNIAATVVIDETICMSYAHSICFSCKDPCLDDAIAFAGMFNPTIEAQKCTACGFCIRYCPTNAIVIQPLSEKN